VYDGGLEFSWHYLLVFAEVINHSLESIGRLKTKVMQIQDHFKVTKRQMGARR